MLKLVLYYYSGGKIVQITSVCVHGTNSEVVLNPKLERRTVILLQLMLLRTSRSGYPLWILKRGGLKSSRQILISLNLNLLNFLNFFSYFSYFFLLSCQFFFNFFHSLSILLRSLLKVTRVTSEYQTTA